MPFAPTCLKNRSHDPPKNPKKWPHDPCTNSLMAPILADATSLMGWRLWRAYFAPSHLRRGIGRMRKSVLLLASMALALLLAAGVALAAVEVNAVGEEKI